MGSILEESKEHSPGWDIKHLGWEAGDIGKTAGDGSPP